MKVQIWYEPDPSYVDAEVSHDDIANSLTGRDVDSRNAAIGLIGAAYTALKGIPQHLIDEMTPEVRKKIVDGFRDQMERYTKEVSEA